MDIKEFAETYHVRVRHDECGDAVIFGKQWKHQPVPKFAPHRPASDYHYGHQIYEYGDGRFGLMLMYDSPKKWNNAMKTLVAASFQIRNEGTGGKDAGHRYDAFGEGVTLFDPANVQHARLALKLAGVKTRRTVSPAQLAVLEKARTALKVA